MIAYQQQSNSQHITIIIVCQGLYLLEQIAPSRSLYNQTQNINQGVLLRWDLTSQSQKGYESATLISNEGNISPFI
ncbi:hypothetical protein FGO68_gene11322 [Halteria grandinella]|uniref:Uncharacterized protein n=1 Tax=Halteria grandinella TaxID=5974 RepID=A0A8J8NCW2_HALGN|nr:hypothetical protein FGO68_gene11322 [Halteria grandinella]